MFAFNGLVIHQQIAQDCSILKRGITAINRRQPEQHVFRRGFRKVKLLIHAREGSVISHVTLKNGAWTVVQVVDNRIKLILAEDVDGSVCDEFANSRQVRFSELRLLRFEHLPLEFSGPEEGAKIRGNG